MRRKADPEFQSRQPQIGANFRGEPRVGRRKRRPDTFVQAAQDHQIGPLQSRLQQAPDEHARMTAIGGSYAHLIE